MLVWMYTQDNKIISVITSQKVGLQFLQDGSAEPVHALNKEIHALTILR